MRVRRMQKEDIAQIAAIEAGTFSQPWSAASFSRALTDENALFLSAVRAQNEGGSDVVLGYIGMYLSPPEGEITNVAVAQKFRGAGCATALVQAMQEAARERGICRIFLEVRKSNAAAIGLYQKMDFREIGERKGFYDFPKEDAKIMVWDRNLDVC